MNDPLVTRDNAEEEATRQKMSATRCGATRGKMERDAACQIWENSSVTIGGETGVKFGQNKGTHDPVLETCFQ